MGTRDRPGPPGYTLQRNITKNMKQIFPDTNSDLLPVKFCHSSSHTPVRGIDSVTSDELLRTLLNLLQSNFASVTNSDDILSREPAAQDKSDKGFTHCIIAGGSNMKRLCPTLQT
jgi:hypothetical protein